MRPHGCAAQLGRAGGGRQRIEASPYESQNERSHSGIGDVRLFRDGQLVRFAPSEGVAQTSSSLIASEFTFHHRYVGRLIVHSAPQAQRVRDECAGAIPP